MNKVNLLAPSNANLNEVGNKSHLLCCYDPIVLSFIDALSQVLLKHPEAKKHPELVALGFWLRKSNLKSMQNLSLSEMVKPVGWVIHFTPANVDTMFIYSWICSLLMGNHNVIRVATKTSDLKNCLLNTLNLLFARPEFMQIGQHNLFVHYDKQSDYSAQFSLKADARVIWGGDDSVNAIRQLPCKPRCRDISFADRYSACVINFTDLTADTNQIQQLAVKLLKDAQPYEQMACSSPRIIYWLGSKSMLDDFLSHLNDLSLQLPSSISRNNNHLVYSQLIKSQQADVQQLIADNIIALKVTELTDQQQLWHSGEGIYLVVQIQQLQDISRYSDEKLQTLSYWGVERSELLKLLAQESIIGIDRIVPVGKALDFSPVWDGFDLFNQLCRKIVLE